MLRPDGLKGFGFWLWSAVELFDDFPNVGSGFRLRLSEGSWGWFFFWGVNFPCRLALWMFHYGRQNAGNVRYKH